jgi:hypothetical protein
MYHKIAVVQDVIIMVDSTMVIPYHITVGIDLPKAGLVDIGSIPGGIIEVAIRQKP